MSPDNVAYSAIALMIFIGAITLIYWGLERTYVIDLCEQTHQYADRCELSATPIYDESDL
jgi:hypothetical protein